ncbi:MAG: hypothetical protein BWY06_01879 [Candidatus Latescibacteria bacterium ADurb.Bin168]|nr:MAG: hypothetical protein BWY06_01879 [Candidatus Latescibacteria bacterium ADurb.Bin168]
MRTSLIRSAVATCLVAVAAVAGCGSDNATGSGGGDISITVSSGTTPDYSWGGGNVYSLSIVRTAAPTTIVWGVVTPASNGVASPTKHGTVATGVIRSANVEPTLTAGVQYRVTVARLDGKTGWKEFTP